MAKLSPIEVVLLAAVMLGALATSGTLQVLLGVGICLGALLGWAAWPLRELLPPPLTGRRRPRSPRWLRSSAGPRSRG
jgi:hypothetical protein